MLVVFFALPLAAQAPVGDEQQVLALVREIVAQQSQIDENQTKIESKLTELTETIRVARIYSSRTGK